MVREVPLLDTLRKHGASLGEFAGWLTAMDYGNPMEEHLATRNEATAFDVSHLGRYVIRGSKLFEFFQKAVSKDLKKFRQGFMSGPVLLLNDEGGIKDDIMLYYLSDDEWLAVVNAPNVEKDKEWLESLRERFGYSESDVFIEDVTLKTALIAIQGPKSADILEEMGFAEAKKLSILQFVPNAEILGEEVKLVSRSGWTGEEVRSYGFEIWTTIDHGRKVFEKALELGAKPAGLIARDSLRLEMGYLLIGCDKVNEYYVKGAQKFRIGFTLKKKDRAIARHGHKIFVDGEEVGYVTSGAYSPVLKRSIGMGYVKASHAYIGYRLDIEIRGVMHEAKILDFPLI